MRKLLVIFGMLVSLLVLSAPGYAYVEHVPTATCSSAYSSTFNLHWRDNVPYATGQIYLDRSEVTIRYNDYARLYLRYGSGTEVASAKVGPSSTYTNLVTYTKTWARGASAAQRWYVKVYVFHGTTSCYGYVHAY